MPKSKEEISSLLGLLNCFLSFISSAAKQRLSQQGSLLAKKTVFNAKSSAEKICSFVSPPEDSCNKKFATVFNANQTAAKFGR